MKQTYDTTKYFCIVDDGKKKTSELLNQLKSKMSVYSYWNDKELDKNFPKPKETTTRYFNKTVEVDTETLGKTFGELQKMGGITFREYILMCIQSDEKLDIIGGTVFSDSLSDGEVARGYWLPGNVEVRFYWGLSGDSDPSWGARLAVSPSTLSTSSLPEILVINDVKYKRI